MKRGRGEGKKRKQGSDTLGNVAIALVFIVIGKITFIELDAYPRTMKWEKGREDRPRYILRDHATIFFRAKLHRVYMYI